MSEQSLTFEQFRQKNRRVDDHDRCRKEWLARHQEICAQAAAFGRNGRAEIAKYLYKRLRDERNLILAFEHIANEGGRAPGPDGETFDDIETCYHAYADSIRDAIDDREFEHGPTNVVNVAKASGVGTRPVQLINLCDRVVHRAVVQVVGPLLDTIFLPHSFGGRPGLDRQNALAEADRLLTSGRRVVLSEDIKDAFEHVPQERLLQLLRKYLPVRPADEVKRRKHGRPIKENLHSLLRKLIVTDKGMGLRQGAATSPLFMNLYAHHQLDDPWQRVQEHPPLLRYIDDLLIMCRSKEEADAARVELERLLFPTPFSLKKPKEGRTNVHDLNIGHRAPWLGFRVSWGEDGMTIRIHEWAMPALKSKLLELSPTTPAGCVEAKILQWVSQMGPAYEHSRRDLFYRNIRHIIRGAGLKGAPSRMDFTWQRAYERWLSVRARAGAFAG